MSKVRTVFRCQSCGTASPQWVGRCAACDEWNTLVEEIEAPLGDAAGAGVLAPAPAVPIGEVDAQAHRPRPTGIDELDRVLGGGLVPGSVTLVGGEPGVGKSTLLLQMAAAMACSGPVLYVSAEESPQQVRFRAQRLGMLDSDLLLASEVSLPALVSLLDTTGAGLVVVDSIQTVHDPTLGSAAGSVAQVRACAGQLVHEAKRRGVSVVLVGHVTKDGALAGPRALEHLVDTVVSFEGDRHHALRLVRAVKHRFGSTDELGLFEMTERGLVAVPDASGLFLADRRAGVSGSVVVPALEGHRPLLVEVQGLVVQSRLVSPRRSAQGVDAGRLPMLLAVLERRAGVELGDLDVYALAVGGVRLDDPAVDLGVALAIASSVRDEPVPDGTVVLGEIGLGGELRQARQCARRLGEAVRLGFTRAVIPERSPAEPAGIEAIRVATLGEALVAVAMG